MNWQRTHGAVPGAQPPPGPGPPEPGSRRQAKSGWGAGKWVGVILLYCCFVAGLVNLQIAWGDAQVNLEPLYLQPNEVPNQALARKTFATLTGKVVTSYIRECSGDAVAPVVADGWDQEPVTVMVRAGDAAGLTPPGKTVPFVVPFHDTGYLYRLSGADLKRTYDAADCPYAWTHPKGERPELVFARDAYIFKPSAELPPPSLLEDGRFWGGLVLMPLTVAIVLLAWAVGLVQEASRTRQTVVALFQRRVNSVFEHWQIYAKTAAYVLVTATLGGVYALVSETVVLFIATAAALNYLLLYNCFLNRRRLEMDAMFGMLGELALVLTFASVVSAYAWLGDWGGILTFVAGIGYVIGSTCIAYVFRDGPESKLYTRFSLYGMEYATAIGVFKLGEIIRTYVAPPDWEGAAAATSIGFVVLLLCVHLPFLLQSAQHDGERLSVVTHRTVALVLEGFVFYTFM